MESPTLRSDEALSTTWSDQPGCLPRVNLQLPHKDHFNYTVQTSLKSPIFPFVYLRECHINWLITVFLSHFQKTHWGKRGEGEKGKLSMPHSWKKKKKQRQTWRHEESWLFLEEGWWKRGSMQLELVCCSRMAEVGQDEWWDGQLWQQSSGCTGRGIGAQWDPALAQQHSPDHDPAPSTCPQAGLSPPWLLCPTQANERKQLFQGGDPIYMHLMLHYTGIS